MSTWTVSHLTGSAAELHARPMPSPPARLVEVLTVTGPSVVLGSTQSDSIVDHDAATAAGLAVAHRRSGGGAVLLVPGESLWVDVVLPPTDPLWVDDVGRAFHWLGDAWVAALAEVGVAGQVHRGGLCTTEWSRLVCFGGLGSGEVTSVEHPEQKIVGMAQRRGRGGARFQCTVHQHWDPARLVNVLALDAGERERAIRALDAVVAEVETPATTLVDALLRHLRRL